MTEEEWQKVGRDLKRALRQCGFVVLAFVIIFLLFARRTHGL